MNESKKTLATESNRLFFVDFLKAISIVAVVSYHSIFIPASAYRETAFWLDTIFAPLRFCVPIFLTVTFMLSERSIVNRSGRLTWDLLKKRLIRLLIPTAFWFGVAIFLKLLTGDTLASLVSPVLTGEIFTGAYYLLILFQLTVLYFCFRRQLQQAIVRNLLVIGQAVIFLGVGMVLSHPDWRGQAELLAFLRRPPFFYWFAYIPLGIYCYQLLPWLTEKSKRLAFWEKALLLVVLSLTFTIEYARLGIVVEGSVPPFEYLMLSCMLSIPVFFLCFSSLQYEDLRPSVRRLVLLFSKYSLGIFCINGILSQLFLSLGSRWFQEAVFGLPEMLLIKLVGWIFLLGVSLGFSILLGRLGFKALVC